MKVWITGIAGAVGSHAAERLMEEGHEVSGVDAYTEYYDPELKRHTARTLAQKGIKITELDVVTADAGTMIPSDTDFIFHFAAQPGISSSTPFDTYVRNNLVATEHLLEAARTVSNLTGFVFISTSSVYGAHANGDEETVPVPTSVYGVTKLAAEQLTLSYGRDGRLPVCVLRFFSVYGERERPEKLFRKLVPAIQTSTPFPLHEGSEHHVRSYTYVGDAVESCVAVIERFAAAKGEIFNIGSDLPRTTREAIAIVENIMGKKGVYESKPPRQGDQLETSAHIAKAKRILGYSPTTTLEEGLAREVAWCLSLGNP